MNAMDIVEKVPEGYRAKLLRGQRILLVGGTGSGKSNAGVSFPKWLYLFDFDNRFRGAVSALNWLGETDFSQIDFDYYNPLDGFYALDTWISRESERIEKRTSKFRSIEIDSLGSLIYSLALESQKLRGALPKDSGGFKGKVRGKVQFLHPDDYNYVATALRLLMFNYFFPLNELGINIIVSAWLSDKYGKRPGAGEFDPPEVIGERILGPPSAVSEFGSYFDEVYYFRREPPTIEGGLPKFTVEFNGVFAKTALGLPSGRFDITNKNFFQFWIEKVGVIKPKVEEPKEEQTNG